MDFEAMLEESRGEFLRSQGLHTDNIASWKTLMEASLEPAKKVSEEERRERAHDRQKIKELERKLNRKDKALTETAALLILKKKRT